MAVIALTSAKGAPGVTSTAVGLTLLWPRPAVLVEADASDSSSVLAGYLQGAADHSRSLVGLGLASRQRPLTTGDLWDQAIELAPDRHLVPGVSGHNQSYALTSMWGRLSEVLASLDRAGVDVLVDAGRVGTAYAPTALLRAADVVLLVTRSRLPDVAAARIRAATLAADLASAGTGADALVTLVVGPGQPYPLSEVSDAVGTRTMQLAWDPVTAEIFYRGVKAGRRFGSAPLTLSLRTLTAELTELVAQRRDRLAPVGTTAPTAQSLHTVGDTDV